MSESHCPEIDVVQGVLRQCRWIARAKHKWRPRGQHATTQNLPHCPALLYLDGQVGAHGLKLHGDADVHVLRQSRVHPFGAPANTGRDHHGRAGVLGQIHLGHRKYRV